MARFGIDIDGTVTSPTSLLPHINKAFQTELVLDDIKEYDLENRTLITSYDWRILYELKKQNPNILRGFITLQQDLPTTKKNV